MGNEQVKIEKEINNMQSNTLNELINKKRILDTLLIEKRHMLTTIQIDKINNILNIIAHKIYNCENNINLDAALKLFKFTGKFTKNELKEKYHILALATHPDKNAGDSTKFNIVQECYKILIEHLIKMDSDKQHHELKTNYKNDTREYVKETKSVGKLDSKNFNNALFNKLYEEHKLNDAHSKGYGDWLKMNDNNATPDLGEKISPAKFNEIFNNYKLKNTANNQIQIYNEPKELISCGIGFADLAADINEIDDFSKAAESRSGIGYMDLKSAYSEKNNFINPDNVKYKTYKNVEEYERDRSSITYTMTVEQMEEMERRNAQEEYNEILRRRKIEERDNAIFQHYIKTHTQMLGYAPSN